jgi:3-oxoacyl-[acyl-carrier-protein] synthase II
LKKRVVITGLGVIAPGGIEKDAFWETIKQGKSMVSRITRFDASTHPSQIAAEINNFDPTDFMSPKDARRSDRSTQFAVAAAKMAVEDAHLKISPSESKKTGVFDSSSLGTLIWLFEQNTIFIEKGYHRMHPLTAVVGFPGSAAAEISRAYKLHGPSLTFTAGSAGATAAIGYGFNAIRSGELDIVLTGGTEAPIYPSILASFCKIDAVSKRNDEPDKASRPFDKSRDGFVLGEGAGMIVLEELKHALDRNAKIYAEILGFNANCDAYHITSPDVEGTFSAEAMKLALKDAHVKPEEIDYINAHGTSTIINDKTETLAIKKAFGAHAKKLAVSSIKSMIGHLLGACGAVELIACALAIENSFIPPTINYEHSDPECDLDYVPNNGRSQQIGTAISINFSFGGKNCALIIRKI